MRLIKHCKRSPTPPMLIILRMLGKDNHTSFDQGHGTTLPISFRPTPYQNIIKLALPCCLCASSINQTSGIVVSSHYAANRDGRSSVRADDKLLAVLNMAVNGQRSNFKTSMLPFLSPRVILTGDDVGPIFRRKKLAEMTPALYKISPVACLYDACESLVNVIFMIKGLSKNGAGRCGSSRIQGLPSDLLADAASRTNMSSKTLKTVLIPAMG